ncbi:phytanoyl-CoA dioxygenase, partial [Klebsiella pneumoniae]
MNSSSANFLDALGASQTLSAQMKHELDTLGYTVVHNVVDAQWLSEMRLLIDTLVEREGDNLAMEHHQEATATRIANLINKGVIWEKVWSHPLILSACRYIFN